MIKKIAFIIVLLSVSLSQAQEKPQASRFRFGVNFSPTLSFGYDFQLGQHAHLRIEPSLRYSLRSLTESNGSGNLYSAGVNLTYCWAKK